MMGYDRCALYWNKKMKSWALITDDEEHTATLVDELLEVIHKYDETLYMATVIGCLELVKQQLINDAVEENDD